MTAAMGGDDVADGVAGVDGVSGLDVASMIKLGAALERRAFG
jgi:hypothetical protein